ncbi:methyltransferase domain-containing protein [Williamsia sp. CHRR-6]|nr:methyltransferase domain-containing protein [Williamsia sp. CHRR-6]
MVSDLDAVRASYDAVADNYVDMVGDPGPWQRVALEAFAEQVRDVGPVLDAGCGPGWVAGLLHERGVDVSGVDLSPRMVEHARRRHPSIPFDVASVTDLRPAAASLGGVLGWWSWFHLPRGVLREVIGTMAVSLRPGGRLLIATHCGNGELRRARCYGDVPVDWTTHLYQPEDVAAMLTDAGLPVAADIRLPPAHPAGSPALIMCGDKPR